MELYFIRHAQSVNNVLYEQTGGNRSRLADPELTDIGRKQADVLAAHLARPVVEGGGYILDYQNRDGFGLTHLYSSLMIRAVETGLVAARACQLPLVGWSEIHERGGIYMFNEETGDREGLPGNSHRYLAGRFPELVLPEGMDGSGWWNRPAETLEQAEVRARLVLQQLLARHGGTEDRVGMVSHGGFFQVFTAVLLNMPALLSYDDGERTARFGINNVSISRFVFTEHTVDVIYLNNTRFLPADLLT